MIELLPVTTRLDIQGHLQIAGCDLEELAEKWGTPLYIYDAATIHDQVQTLQTALQQFYSGDWDITYAAKAYFSLGIAKHLAAMDLGVDVVSRGELILAQQAGFEAHRIHLHGNNKTEEELRLALDAGIQSIVVDSLEEMIFLEKIASQKRKIAPIWLRINPGVAAHTHRYVQTAHVTSKFGIPVEDGQAKEAIRIARSSQWLELTGLHTHIGSQIFESTAYKEAITVLVSVAEGSGFIPREFSPGGGWGVPYTLDGSKNDPQSWVQGITSTVQEEFSRRNWPLPKLVLEPGRLLVARAGVALYRVGTTKFTGDGTWIVSVDGGMADNIRPALYQAKYVVVPVAHPNAALVHHGALVGRFCETGDQIITDIGIPDLKRGDLVAIPVSGAYQLSMASNYNLVSRPAVLWLQEGQVEILQRRENPEESAWWTGS